ncbi:MAG: iron ABC transporter permease [Phycisphaerales bacterium]|nr:iron ABC transporter permease [Phycisphaerales bacterium]
MKRLSAARFWGMLAACFGGLALVVVMSPGIGTQWGTIGWRDAWQSLFRGDHDSMAFTIGFQIRMARTVLALQAGITLGLCGAVFQMMFRNALATPYTLGVVNGGSLGALIAVKLGWAWTLIGLTPVSISSFVGSLFVIGLILLITRVNRRMGTAELLLAGVTMGLFCSAMMMLVTYLSNQRETFNIVRWMMGSLEALGAQQSAPSLVLLVPSWVLLLLQARGLNQYMLGEDLAMSRGVDVRRLQLTCLVFASLATSAVVAICGPIGFVGLVVPQMTALVLGRDCRLLLPASAILGGVFLAVCDWLSQIAMGMWSAISSTTSASASLPIGVVTAIVGVPIFLVLLYRRGGFAE